MANYRIIETGGKFYAQVKGGYRFPFIPTWVTIWPWGTPSDSDKTIEDAEKLIKAHKESSRTKVIKYIA